MNYTSCLIYIKIVETEKENYNHDSQTWRSLVDRYIMPFEKATRKGFVNWSDFQ